MKVTAAARRALFLLLLIPGFALASWVTRTPALRDGLSASTQQMGGILFGFSLGAMCGVLSAGWLTQRLSARRVARYGLLVLIAGLALLATSLAGHSAWLAFGGLFAFGVGIGWAEIAINVEAASVERALERPLMTTLHGFFSLGTLLGALLGMAMTALGVSMLLHLLLVVVFGVAACLIGTAQMSDLSSARTPTATHNPAASGNVWRELANPGLLLICYIVLAMALAEGTANDWLPLLMIDGHGFDATAGTRIYVGFTLAMTLGRFIGGPFVERLGTVRALCGSAVLGTLGLAATVFSPWPALAAASVMLWGVGAALGFPLALSLAADVEHNRALRVSIAATAGYVGFLVGPPMLGMLGQHFGLRLAMLPVMLVVALSLLAASLVGRRSDRAALAAARR